MLPSRLFRNVGIPPPFRSLVQPSRSLPAPVRVQIHLRVGVGARLMSSSACRKEDAHSLPQPRSSASSSSEPVTTSRQALPERMDPRLRITFTCTVTNCNHRSSHEFSRQAYESGVVLVKCPSCHNRHLIADHLGWFKDSTSDAKQQTVEDILRVKGETVRRRTIDLDGNVEVIP
ncbi:zf-DNL-domain-containing protein [Fistulina hepatica ATCC 64428]|uniref:Zf-DNL-domain-containing protein n=1 Tax=Fistulina hepatica ATCC 64428 TaxID=1128425 RepID=A0A0D7A2G5_9AGAR|nr:zf-DNL-domain-containing protein [Fistulina hepatica ATCC 64428]